LTFGLVVACPLLLPADHLCYIIIFLYHFPSSIAVVYLASLSIKHRTTLSLHASIGLPFSTLTVVPSHRTHTCTFISFFFSFLLLNITPQRSLITAVHSIHSLSGSCFSHCSTLSNITSSHHCIICHSHPRTHLLFPCSSPLSLLYIWDLLLHLFSAFQSMVPSCDMKRIGIASCPLTIYSGRRS